MQVLSLHRLSAEAGGGQELPRDAQLLWAVQVHGAVGIPRLGEDGAFSGKAAIALIAVYWSCSQGVMRCSNQ